MSSIVTAVFKATVGSLVNKGRHKAAEKLKDGDVTDQNFRRLIVGEIDDIKSKLEALSKKDLKSSISLFRDGIELLYEVLDKAKPRGEYGALTTQAAGDEAFSVAEGMRNLELTDLDETATRALSSAKERFKKARENATEAFHNEALETSDRILAMQYRVMATILETVDNPTVAVAPCRACIEELNSMPAVRESFDFQLKKGLSRTVRGLLGKEERKNIISYVCHVNRIIYDVTGTIGKVIWKWPAIDTGEGRVDPLRDERVTHVLREQGMEHCCAIWSLGQEGEWNQRLKAPRGIATNASGHFIVGDEDDHSVKVFDSTGTFVTLFSLPNDLRVLDVATDINDIIYVLVGLKKPEEGAVIYASNATPNLHRSFPVVGDWDWDSLTVTDSGKVLVGNPYHLVMYKTDGQFVCWLDQLNNPCFTAANDGLVMAVSRRSCSICTFSDGGDHLKGQKEFTIRKYYYWPKIAFHRASEHAIVASLDKFEYLLHVDVYTKNGEFVRSFLIHEERNCRLTGLTATTQGRIAVICEYQETGYLDWISKVLVL